LNVAALRRPDASGPPPRHILVDLPALAPAAAPDPERGAGGAWDCSQGLCAGRSASPVSFSAKGPDCHVDVWPFSFWRNRPCAPIPATAHWRMPPAAPHESNQD